MLKLANSVNSYTTVKMTLESNRSPLYYGTKTMKGEDVPEFGSGRKIIEELEKLMMMNKPVSSPLKGELFRK